MNTISTHQTKRFLPLRRGPRPMPPQRVRQSPVVEIEIGDGGWWHIAAVHEALSLLLVAPEHPPTLAELHDRLNVAAHAAVRGDFKTTMDRVLDRARDAGRIYRSFWEYRRGRELWLTIERPIPL